MNRDKLTTLLLLSAMVGILIFEACNKKSPVTPDCIITDVSFSEVIVPILEDNCYGCHSGNNPSSGIPLDSYEAIKQQVANQKLYGSIARLPGYVPMPLNKDSLPKCKINQIKAWIDEGANNN